MLTIISTLFLSPLRTCQIIKLIFSVFPGCSRPASVPLISFCQGIVLGIHYLVETQNNRASPERSSQDCIKYSGDYLSNHSRKLKEHLNHKVYLCIFLMGSVVL